MSDSEQGRFEVYPRKRNVELIEYERWEASEGENPKPVELTGDFGWRYRAANGHILADSTTRLPRVVYVDE